MSLKTEVLDRVPTYPGRVTLTPVSGQANTYDLKRADAPVVEGTPINKVLLDNKAYTLTKSATVYVNGSTGNDETGDGSETAPYATIQKAVDSVPKCLGGFTATVDIADGSYLERVRIDGFYGGRLELGAAGRDVTVLGVSVLASGVVRLNIPYIAVMTDDESTLLYVGSGSNVLIVSPITINGVGHVPTGLAVEQNSILAAIGSEVTINNCTENAIHILSGSRATFGSVSGSGNGGVGFRANAGSVLSYVSSTLTAATAAMATGGGKIYSGAQSNIPMY